MEILKVDRLQIIDKYRTVLKQMVGEINSTTKSFSMNKFMQKHGVSRNLSSAIQVQGICTYNNQNNSWYSKVEIGEVNSELTLRVLQEMYAQKGQVF